MARLQRTLTCVTPAILARTPGAASDERGLLLNRSRPVPLSGLQSLRLDIEVRYVVRPVGKARDWEAHLAGYIYAIQGPDEEDLLAYHWHPASISRVTWPHLHVARITHELVSGRTHLPTGQVQLEDMVRLLIEEFSVQPRRRDWAAVLDASRVGGTG